MGSWYDSSNMHRYKQKMKRTNREYDEENKKSKIQDDNNRNVLKQGVDLTQSLNIVQIVYK